MIVDDIRAGDRFEKDGYPGTFTRADVCKCCDTYILEWEFDAQLPGSIGGGRYKQGHVVTSNMRILARPDEIIEEVQ